MSHRLGTRVPRRFRLALTVAVGVFAAATAAGLLVLWPDDGRRPDLTGIGFFSEVFDAEVIRAEDVPCQGQPQPGVTCRRVTFELTGGPDAGRLATQELVQTGTTPRLEEGDRVVLARTPGADPQFEYRFVDRDRGAVLVWLAVAFVVAVVLLGRLRGLAALAGLAVSLVVLLTFILPAVLDGRNPLAVAIVGSAAIAFLALYLAHGFTTMTTVALLGTLSSLALTAVLAHVFVGLARLSGFATEEAIVVQVGAANIDLAGIILGGMVIGALGAIDDMTVTQASAVWELRAADPRMSRASLIRSGLRVGRDHVASTVNTLALAYAGASMPVLLLLVLSRQSLATVANGEVIATEILRTLVGSIGLVAAVPVTTWLAALAAPTAPDEALTRRAAD
ncbi:MAG TPA: YibE/F family protein [Actinomycetota bacterium]|nr:YibE/F family protein [Actinomycetota bacterium]